MGVIQELSPTVINQIAAGEVVERPASVVKELLENAVDAGADRVELSVERGGKDLIRVADNGEGIARDDLLRAFLPHATSKLRDAGDLHRVRTLGFRGEALAAIAEVSRIRCQTRTADEQIGSELTIEGGSFGDVRDHGGPVGTIMEVRNLFFNTPVRRTYLKTDATEGGHVAEIFTRIALAQPKVHLTLKSGSKTLYDLPPATGIKERIAVFFGQPLGDSLLWVENEAEGVHLWGYVAHPSETRSSPKGQYLFVGGRFVRDRALGHALTEAYRGLIMTGRYPVAFLNLDLPPEEVDVNVHPTKIEVRFRDSQRIYGQLLASVRRTFLASDLHSRLQAPTTRHGTPTTSPHTPTSQPSAPAAPLERSTVDRETIASWFPPSEANAPRGEPRRAPPPPRPADSSALEEPAWVKPLPPAPSRQASDSFDEFDGAATPIQPPPRSEPQPTEDASEGEPTVQDSEPPPTRPLEDLRMLASPRRLQAIQLHDSYLVAETEDGMVVIDQHALHERILFEELRSRIEAGGLETQKLLIPDEIDLGPEERAALEAHREVMETLGLAFEAEEGDPVRVLCAPALLGKRSPGPIVRELAERFRDHPNPPTQDTVLSDALSLIACKAAIKANQHLSKEEIEALLDRRHLVQDTHHCPHGRPTALIFTKAELEKQFGRLG